MHPILNIDWHSLLVPSVSLLELVLRGSVMYLAILAALRGLNRRVLTGEILELQFASQIAQFRVMWVGQPGTARQGEIGIVSLPCQPPIWDLNLGRCVQIAGNG